MSSSPAMSFILSGGGGDYGKISGGGGKARDSSAVSFLPFLPGKPPGKLGQSVNVPSYRRDNTSLNNQNNNVKFLSLPK